MVPDRYGGYARLDSRDAGSVRRTLAWTVVVPDRYAGHARAIPGRSIGAIHGASRSGVPIRHHDCRPSASFRHACGGVCERCDATRANTCRRRHVPAKGWRRDRGGDGRCLRRTVRRHGWRRSSAQGWLERVRRRQHPSPPWFDSGADNVCLRRDVDSGADTIRLRRDVDSGADRVHLRRGSERDPRFSRTCWRPVPEVFWRRH